MEFEYGSNSDSYSDSDSDMYSDVEDQDPDLSEIITNLLNYDDEKYIIRQKYEFALYEGTHSDILTQELDLLDENEQTELDMLSKEVFKLPISKKTENYSNQEMKEYTQQELENYEERQQMKEHNIRSKYIAQRDIILYYPLEAYKKIKEKKLTELAEKYKTINIHLIYRYVVNYLFAHISPVSGLTEVDIKESLEIHIKTNFSEIIKRYNKLTDEYKSRLYEDIEKGLNIVLEFYVINEIPINEIRILPRGHEIIDVLSDIDKPTILDCLADTNNLLFVTVNTSNCDFNSFSYHAVCYNKKIIQKAIFENQKKFDCFINDPTIYIKLPIGPNAINVYIPLLSALAILQSDKLIFYLLPKDPTKCTESENHQPQHCDKDNTLVMYLAKCGGFNCAPKGWTGAEDEPKTPNIKKTSLGIKKSKPRLKSKSQKTNIKKVN